MLRSRLLVSVATPLFAASLLLPSVAVASPYARSVPLLGMQDPGGESLAQPIPGQTPVAPVNTQVQAPGTQSQATPPGAVAGPQSQSQTLAAPGAAPLTVPPGSTVMQPQIQVLVQPQIQVQAQPQGNATPTSSADISTNSNSNSNSNATPTVTTNTRTTPPQAPVYVAPPQQRYPQTRYAPPPPPPRIVTRVVSRPSHAAPPPAIKRPPPPRKGLMVTGWVLFGVSYLITASNAADLYDRCPGMNKPGRCRDLAENMFIPVVGPFLAMDQAKYATDDFSLAVSGSLQGLGLIMGIVGTVQYHRDKYRNRVLNEYGVRVAKNTNLNAGGRLGGGQLTLTARF
jgi:hypothetical protein